MYHCKLSVRTLVEFVYRSGDLIHVPTSFMRAQIGSRIHRELQTNASGNYKSEVFLKLKTEVETVLFEIEGRADGIYIDNNEVLLEEIKTTSLPYESIDNSKFVHFAQAYCYGYMYMVSHALQTICIQLTYYQIETNQSKYFKETKTFDELHIFYMQTLQRYVIWANLAKNIKETSIQTLRELQFPFPQYRPGQRKFAISVYKTIVDKDTLFAQAPTGIGKTISTLFPSLKALGEEKAEKIFYVCAKNITASVAFATMNELYKQDVHFKTLSITAKDKLCLLEERTCDPALCPYAKGYYNRCNDALYEALQQHDFLEKEIITQLAQKYTICPFELSLDISVYADVIIADYNYVFDPRVYLKRFFTESGRYIFLIDEAHNLVDRAREMYSADILQSSFLQIKSYIPAKQKTLLQAIHDVHHEFAKIKKQYAFKGEPILAQKEPILGLLQTLASFSDHTSAYLQSEHDEQYDLNIQELYYQVLNYLNISEYYDANFITWISLKHNDVYIKQFCMNPTNPIRETLKKGSAAIFFSATLSPIEYFESLLGGTSNKKRLALPSIFSHTKRKCIINDHISTKYRNRNASISPLITYMYNAIQCKVGNYIVFCPSYVYMEQISQSFQKQYPTLCVHIQKSNMNEKEKEIFLQHFEQTERQQLFFCVLGGMFSEGIDLVGKKLIGTIIIGVGLPQNNPQQDMVKDHFDQINHMGYAYSYQFPGMNKVLQAAGRVHRTLDDKGIIIFIDERFTTSFYQGLFPNHLLPFEIIHDPLQLKASLTTFWE